MKKFLFLSPLFIIVFIFLFLASSFGQGDQTPEAYVSLAQSYEKVKSYKLAADHFMLAGKAYEAKAKEYTTDASINKNLQSAVDAYSKAAENYKKGGKIIEQNDAQREAMRTSVPLIKKKLEAYQDSVKKNPPPDLKAAIKQIPWKPGKIIIMDARGASYEMTMPDALKFIGPRKSNSDNHEMLRKNETSFFVVENNKPSPHFQFTLKEYSQDDKANSNKTQSDCDETAKKFATPGAGVFFGKTEVKTIDIGKGIKACVSTHESQQMDTKKYIYGWEMLFAYKNNSYLMTGSAPYAWKDCIQEMLKTFHFTNEQPGVEVDLSCFGNNFKEVPGLAFDDTWMLPDPKGTLVIKLSPNLPRTQVPYAWHEVINATRKLVGQIEELSAKFETKEENGIEMDVLEFVVDYFEVPQISPGELADAYLEVLDKVITAISGLEGKISGISVDLSYELPYIEVKTKCIPRFKCVNEKWQPDYSEMSFEKTAEVRRVDKKEYFNLSPGVLKQTEAKINELPRRLESDAKKVAEKECGQHRYKLHDIKWPPTPKQCEHIEKKITLFKVQLQMYTGEKTELKRELTEYSNSKSKKIDAIKRFITQINDELKTKEKDLASAKAEKKTYELNKETMEKTQYDVLMQKVNDKIKKLELETDGLNTEKADWNEKLAMLQSDKFERINYDRTSFVDGEIARLNSEIKVAEAQLKSCREKEKLFQKN